MFNQTLLTYSCFQFC